MNNYSDYNPDVCDGHRCPVDCEHCRYAEKAREANAQLNEYDCEEFDGDGDVYYGNETRGF